MSKLTPAQRETLARLEAICARGDQPGPYGRGCMWGLRLDLEEGRRDAEDDRDLARVERLFREVSPS